MPGVVLPLSALTDKDRADLTFALELGVDWVALSFVQRPDDVAEARKLIGGRAAVLVKLEKPAAIERLDEIIELSDAVMVARGDLGVEMPPEDVPGLQKRIVARLPRAGKPVMVATQMLESMVHAPAPTRAEASDVATAVYDGADAVMLSAETASGEYPIEAVAMMDRIIARVEHDPLYRRDPGCRTIPSRRRPRRRDHRRRGQVAHTVSRGGDRHLHHLGLDDAARRARAAGRADPGPDRSLSTARAWRWPGACIACRPRTSRASPRWSRRPAASRSARGSPRSASAW